MKSRIIKNYTGNTAEAASCKITHRSFVCINIAQAIYTQKTI